MSESSNEPSGWWWQCLADGQPVERAVQEFPTRGDAESWLGEAWAELADEGVDAVTLFEAGRKVYGPMSLEV